MADAPAPTPDAEQQPAAASEAAAEPTAAEEAATEAATEPAAETAPEPPADIPAEPAAVAPATAVAPAAAVAAPADEPTLASTVEVPASLPAPATAAPTGGETQEGGEFELLLEKLRQWLSSGQLQQQWQAARSPLSLLAGLIALLLVLRLYGALLAVLDSIPLLPGLLELVGVIAVVQFSLTRLVRSDDRREVLSALRNRWTSFRGRS